MTSETRPNPRAILNVTGDDAADFLSGLITTAPPDMAGEARFGALLTPQGKILFDFIVVKTEQGFLFDVAASAAADFAKRLTLYRLRSKVEINVDDEKAVALGEAPAAAISYDDPRSADLPRRHIVDVANAATTDWPAFEAARIAAGVCETHVDFGSGEVFPMDVNFDLLGGVDYQKGCFVGQEVASRMKRKSDVRKRTLVAKFDGASPEKGAPVVAGETTLGHLMSGADGRALALIRIDRWLAATTNATCGGADVSLRPPAYLELTS